MCVFYFSIILNSILICIWHSQNEVVGLMGIGDAHFVSSNTPLKYTVYFESDSNATLPVQRVYITYPLDTNLDLGTFRLQQIGFSTFTSEVILNMAYIEVVAFTILNYYNESFLTLNTSGLVDVLVFASPRPLKPRTK